MGIEVYNMLPPFIQNASDNNKTFKTLLKKFLYSNSFCLLDEHINYSGTMVAQWLWCCATNRKVAGSIPDGVTGIFY